MRSTRGAVAIVLAAVLAGCTTQGGVVRSASLQERVPVAQAFMSPPPGGPAPIAVLERRYSNALAQTIVLENASLAAGQNAIHVRAYGPMGPDAGTGQLEADLQELRTIRRELVERFPNIRMEVSGLYAQNRYGPLGYAVGRSTAGDTCIYVWQRIAPEARVFSFQRGAVTWRLRLCDPHADTRTLLLVAYGLTVNGFFRSKTWNPFGDPPDPDPRIGTPGETILPQQVVDPTVVAPVSFSETRAAAAPPRRPASRTRPARAAPAPRPVVLNRPVEGAAVVPRPEATDLSEPQAAEANLPPESGGTTGLRRPPLPPAPAAPR